MRSNSKRFTGFTGLSALIVFSFACSLLAPAAPNQTTPPASSSTADALPTATLAPAPEGMIAYASERNGRWQVIAMNADGGAETSLTERFGVYSRPAWSPDGQQIAMRTEIEMGSGIAVMAVQRESGQLTGSAPIQLFQEFSDAPRWSPDGTQLVYVASGDPGGWEVKIWDLSLASGHSVPGIPKNSVDPDWSPDGKQIVFALYTDPLEQLYDLFAINIDGSGLVQLTNTPTISETAPSWSPDGQRIVFTAFETKDNDRLKTDIFVMNQDGTNVSRVTTDPKGDFDPSWSPDGQQIVFVSNRHENNDSNYEIYVIDVDGSNELRLTNNRSTDRWPTWRARQPDDVAETDCQPSATLAADVTIPRGTRFASPQAFSKVWRLQNSGSCTWTPTNYVLRFVDGEQLGDVTQVMVPGAIQPGATVDLAIPQTAPAAPGVHTARWQLFHRNGQVVPGPDGSPLTLSIEIEVLQPGQAVLPQPLYFLSEQSGSAQLWRMETNASTIVQITHESQPVIAADISATGKLAYNTQSEVIVADANGQNRQVVASLETDTPARRLAWSADGSRLAYPSQGIHVYDLSTGEDRLLIADKDTQAPDLARYEPLEWSPDGSKLSVTKYLWENFGISVISTGNGEVLFDQLQQTITWNIDSQSVYLSSPYYSEWTGLESGLWRGAMGQAPQPLIQGASIWWPTQRKDGTLAFFIHQPTTHETREFAPLLHTSAADATNPVAVNSWPVLISMNDTFNGIWAEDGQSILIQLVRPALNSSEVLLLSTNEDPPVFLTSETTVFWWGQ